MPGIKNNIAKSTNNSVYFDWKRQNKINAQKSYNIWKQEPTTEQIIRRIMGCANGIKPSYVTALLFTSILLSCIQEVATTEVPPHKNSQIGDVPHHQAHHNNLIGANAANKTVRYTTTTPVISPETYQSSPSYLKASRRLTTMDDSNRKRYKKPKGHHTAIKNPKFNEIYRNDPELRKLVNSMGIHYYEGEHTDLGISEEQMGQEFRKIALQIRRVMPYVMNIKVLKRVLRRREPRPKIMLQPPKDMTGKGTYDKKTNTIFIVFDISLSDEELILILTNEVHHMAVCDRQRDKNLKNCLTFPQPKLMNNILKNGYKKINAYYWIYKNYRASGENGEIPLEIRQLTKASTSYIPVKYDINLSIEDHNGVLQQPHVVWLKDGRLFIPQGAYLNNVPCSADIYATVGKEKNGSMIYKLCFAKDDTPEERAWAFLVDMKQREISYEQGYYATMSPFFKQDFKNKVAEKMSDLDYSPKTLKQLFFPKYCRKLSKFHGVPDYCRSMEYVNNSM